MNKMLCSKLGANGLKWKLVWQCFCLCQFIWNAASYSTSYLSCLIFIYVESQSHNSKKKFEVLVRDSESLEIICIWKNRTIQSLEAVILFFSTETSDVKMTTGETESRNTWLLDASARPPRQKNFVLISWAGFKAASAPTQLCSVQSPHLLFLLFF